MEHMREYTISVLKDLIDVCRDEYTLFKTASENILDESLRLAFKKYSHEKEEHIIKLEAEVRRLGGDLNKTEIQKTSNQYIAKTAADTQQLLSECVRRDTIAVNLYSTAIREDILWEVIPLVAKQYFGSKNIHDQIYNIYNKVQNAPKAALA